MTWTRSSYMEPVTSKTNARVDAPSGISSLTAPLGASCPVHRAADSATESHSSPEPIFTSELLLSCLSEYYSSVLFTWFEALRHRAPPVWTSSCCLCVSGLSAVASHLSVNKTDRQSRQLQKRLLSEESGALVQPCHTKTTSQLGKESPQAQTTPFKVKRCSDWSRKFLDHSDNLK